MAAQSEHAEAAPVRVVRQKSSVTAPLGLLQRSLRFSSVYSGFQRAIGGSFKERYVQLYVRPHPRDRVLDLGCGPGDIVEYLRDTSYVGLDLSEDYIAAAKKRFQGLGTFICKNISDVVVEQPRSFDIVMANGVLHHLTDVEAVTLLRVASSALKPGGRFVSHDGCFVDGQAAIARWLLRMDRGAYVRPAEAYCELAAQVFHKVRSEVRSDLLRVPYSHIILECTGDRSLAGE